MRSALRLALVALTAGPCAAGAQAAGRTYGIYAGYSNATMRGDSVPGPLSKNGFQAGAFLVLPAGERLAIQTELMFAQKGVTTIDARSTGVVSTDISASYVELAELLRLNAGQWGGVSPYLLAGPEFALKAGCSVVAGGVAGNYTCADVGSVGGATNGVQSSDFGGIVGAGFDFRMGAR